ncbi:MAG: hypothetical protein UIG59_03645 [Acutalibacteraceae bacterium]|nr:hypothetical protein [Acutalibacteraceae bacterium]
MDKSQFEKYIAEMRKMQAMATLKVNPPTQAAQPPESHENAEDMTGEGRLIVNVTSVRGIYPVSGALVTVFTGDESNMVKFFEGVTDISGKTPVIPLPAPSEKYTEAPDPTERPYAFYNIKTSADGFNDNYNYNVTVFDKVTSLQNVGLTPIATQSPQNRPIVIDEFENYTL